MQVGLSSRWVRVGGSIGAEVGTNESRYFATQMLVEIEAEDEDVMREGSILDHLTSGLIAEQGKSIILV